MQYCLVENGAITEGPRALPTAWGSVSGLQYLNADELKALGWLPHRLIPMEEQYKIITDTIFTIGTDEVVESYTARDMTQEEIDAENKAHWSGVRNSRDKKLQETDYTQLADAPLTQGDKSNWATYRQALRDITKQADPKNIVWPQEPGAGIGVSVL
jgi:hypothetical protein